LWRKGLLVVECFPWGSRGRKFESSHPGVGSDCKIVSFFVFYGQFISQHLHDSTLLALGAPFPASCVHVYHFVNVNEYLSQVGTNI